MNLIFTLNQRAPRWMAQLVIISILTAVFSLSYAQTKNFATTATVRATQVDNPSNATSDGNNFATVKSRGGTLFLGKFSGELELRFPTVLPANTTSFIRIDSDPDILNALLGGNLGGLLADVLGNVILGDHVFEVGARNVAGTTLISASSSAGFNSPSLRLIKDGAGFFYMAITPNQPYDKVYVKDITNALLLGSNNETRVYNAFYFTGTEACATGFATGFEGNGLTVDVLGIGKAGVTNAERAIDADQTNFSEISLGALGVAGSISQNIYFSTLSTPGDEFSVRLSINPALISAGVLDNITISAYNGNNAVFSQNLNALLTLDLLGLLNAGTITNVPFKPNLPFDRVQIRLNSLLNVGLTQTVNLYSVSSSAARPTFTAPISNSINICYNTTAALAATTAASNELVWYDVFEGGSALATTAYNANYVTPALLANKTFYVAARKLGCTAESIRVPISVVVNPAIVFGTTTLANANSGKAYSNQINLATGGTPNFTYALTAGSQLPAGLVLSTKGQIGGLPTTPGDFAFNITVTDSRNCTAIAAFTLKVTSPLVLPAATMPNGTVGTLYPPQMIPVATGGTGPHNYVATNLPPGLSFDPATLTITGTPTQSGNYAVNIVVSDADGNQTSNNYNIVVEDPLVLAAVPLADGIVGTTYLTQTLPPASGGTTPYTYSASNLPPGLSFNPLTREITGTPSQSGTFVIPVSVSDDQGKTITVSYTIGVQDPLSLPAQTLPDGNVNAVYPAQTLPAASGGVGPYTYTATNLPNGLLFDNATRQITGTPTQAGNYSITLIATDAQQKTISNTYALSVIGALNLPTANLPSGTVAQSYPTQTLPAVTGGTAPYTYLASNLPPGLSFNTTTSELSGVPTQGGNYVITLTASDAGGNTVNTNYSITVNVTAPIAANTTICSGAAATLNVSNLQAGVSYNWYGPTGNTALSSNNNGTFITPIVTASTTFYLEAVSGTAVSARTAVTVNINPAPNTPTVLTGNQIINSGQSTVLQVSANAGETIQWFANPTGGTSIATGPSFTTPNLTATTIYYAEAVSASGCASLNRAGVTVTVLNGSTTPNCNFANSQNSGISGICIACSISNPSNSTDADLANFTRISLAVGVGAQGFQRLIFPSAGTATDSIRLDLATPTGLLDLGVLGGVTVTVLNGSAVVSTYQLNSALIDLRLLSGNRFKATFLAGGTYDRVEVRFGATVAALSSLDIYSAEIIYPRPTLSSTGLNLCAGNTTVLTATPNGGTTLTWYSAATGGSVLANGSTFTTPVLTTTTTYYIEVSKSGCANTERTPVTVNVTPVLAVPVIATPSASCQGATVNLSVSNPDPAITYQWFETATNGTVIFTGSSFTTPSLTTNKIYYVEASQGGCVSATRAAVSITVNPSPLAPQVQASSSTIDQGQTAVLTASSTEANINFNWFDAPNATNPIFTGATFITPPLNATTSYYVESVNTTTSCVSSSRVQVTITVNGVGTVNPVPCEAASVQTNGVNGVLTILAGVANPNLAIDNDTQTGSTLFIPVGLAGSVFQRLSFANVSNVGDTVKISINSPGRLLSAAVLGSLHLTTYNAGTSNNDALVANNPLINLNLLSGGAQALLTFVPTAIFDAVEIRLNSGLVGALTSVNVNYAQQLIAKPTVTAANVAVCANQPATLAVSNFNIANTYKWYDAAGVLQATTNTADYTTPAITANTKYFVTVSTASGCESAKTEVNVTVNPLPVVPELLFANVNSCSGNNVVLEVKNPVSGTIYKWYDGSGVYQAGLDGVTFTIASVTANTTYGVEAVNACGVSARATANITVGATVDAPIVTPAAVTVSEGSAAILTASSSTSGAVFNWYASASSTTIIFTGATFLTPVLTTNTTYFVEVVVPGACPASARTSVVVTVVPNGTPIATPCGAATIALADGVSGVALLAGVANPNLAIDNDIQTGSSLLMPVGALGASVFQRVGFSGGLSHVGDTLKIKLSSPAKLLSLAVLPNLSITTYNGSTSNADALVLNNPLIQLDLLGDGSSLTLSFVPTQVFDGVEVRLNSGLLGALTSINFDYAQRINLAPQVVASTVSVCQGAAATLSVNNPQTGVTYRWFLENTFQADGVSFTTPIALSPGTYNYYVRALAFGCESAPTKVVVTVLAPPAAPIPITGNPTKACIGSSATLAVQAVAGVNFNWYDANGNLLVLNNASYTTPVFTASGTFDFFVEAVNGSTCASASRTQLTIIVNPSATATDIIVDGNITVCGARATTLTASSTTVVNPVFTWYGNAALTDVVFVGSAFNTPILTANTTYYVTVSGDNKCENSVADASAVAVVINPSATAADISLSGSSTICEGSTVSLTASSATVTNPIFTWYRNANLTDVAFVGNVFTTPALSANTTYYLTVKGDNKCENTQANALAITITISPTALSSDIVISGATSICKDGNTILTASSSTINNPIFTWYNDAALTAIAFTGSVFNTPVLTTSKTYYVTVKGDNKCESAAANAAQVTVDVKDFALAADVTVTDAVICSGSQTTLNASSFTVSNPVFTWYSDASLTVVANVGPTFIVPALTNTTSFYVTVKGTNKCENIPANAKVVTINVNALAGMTDIIVTGNATACAGSPAQFTATSPTVNNPVFSWYADAALTNLVFIGSSFTSAPLFLNTTFYVTVKGDNRCENTSATAKAILIMVNPTPADPIVASTGRSICSGQTTTLTISNPVNGVNYQWYSSAANGVAVFVGDSFTTPILNANTTYYVQAEGAGGCNNSGGRISAQVTVTPQPLAPTVVSNNVSVCIGNTTVLTITNPVANVVYTWYTTATGGTAVGNGTSFNTPIISANITYYAQATSGSCQSSTRTPVAIIALPVPLAPLLLSSATNPICAGGTTVITVNNPDPNLNYRWYPASSGGTFLAEGTSFTTPALTTSTMYYVESISKLGGCTSINRTSININVLPVLAAPTVIVGSVTANSVTFTWNAVSGASAYEISINNGISWLVPNGGTSHTQVGLKPGDNVTIIVRAIGTLSCQTSANSAPVTGTSSNPFANDLFIPNTFTPNGDGRNDEFLAYGNTVSRFKMRIYNQWGEFLYESNALTSGWDGRYKGNIQPSGVYVYYIDVTFNDGTTKSFKGTITLLR